jgi:uncharacterized protein (TIGR03083 family)
MINAAAEQFDELLSALRHSHERLAACVAPLTGQELAAGSYDDDWTIAQVLSHLGSSAEIFAAILQAGLNAEPPPEIGQIQPVWDRWNAKDPHEQADDAISVDAAFVQGLGALSQTQRAAWRMSLFGGEQELGDFVRMRLGEHAVHTWDIAVAFDSEATVAGDAVALLVDSLDRLVARVAKPGGVDLHVHVTTRDPERVFLLEVGAGGARLSPTESQPSDLDPVLRLPAEAWLRLVYGRLDPEHTPPIQSGHVDLDTLRGLFPGL